MIVIFDCETTTFNKGHPFDPRNALVSYSLKYEGVNHFKYYTDPDFVSFVRDVVARATTLVGHNIKFDLHWLWRIGIDVGPSCAIWDTSLAEFILSGQQNGFISLNEALESYGLPIKKDAVKEYWDAGVDTKDIPLSVLREYNMWDVECTEALMHTQEQLLSARQMALLCLEGQDLLALSSAERAGIKWDKEGADKRAELFERDLEEIEQRLSTYLPAGIPDQCRFNWDSGDQLSALLYGGTINYEYSISEEAVYKSGPSKGESYTRNRWYTTPQAFPPRFSPLDDSEVKKTKDNPEAQTRFYQVDEPTLKQLKTRRREDKILLATLFERAKKIKVVEMINSINNKIVEKNWQDGCIHPQYNQNVVITGRLSSSAPNMQNTPPEIDEFLVSRYG